MPWARRGFKRRALQVVQRLLVITLFAASSTDGAVLAAADAPPFTLRDVLSAVIKVSAEIPPDARTAEILGTARAGSGVVIDSDGLVLTIGYIILEAMTVDVTDATGKTVPADIIAYDYDTGFGLVRARRPLDVKPMRLGNSATLRERAPVLVAGAGGVEQTLGGFVISRREFAGYWEYLLDSAIFTAPPHPNWTGAALIGAEGKLLGIGSLLLEDAMPGRTRPLAGNMFIPINLLKPILADLLTEGRADTPRRPWLGMFSSEAGDEVTVIRVVPEGPAARAGLKSGDVVLRIKGQSVTGVADMYRKLWSLGAAGVVVPLTVRREDAVMTITVQSGDRYDHLKRDGAL